MQYNLIMILMIRVALYSFPTYLLKETLQRCSYTYSPNVPMSWNSAYKQLFYWLAFRMLAGSGLFYSKLILTNLASSNLENLELQLNCPS